MAEKQKRASATSIGDRIRKARGEGRTQQALELARQLYKHEPTGENLELLRQASLERGDQLRTAGYLKDAVTVLGNCIDMGGSPEFQAKLAEKLAASGAVALAMKLTAQVPEGERAAILGHLVDSALRQGPAGKAPLPLELHASFDLITEAFALAEKGDDEAARTALQGIGLQSPFLEWKLMLRGLLAWYANDDSRALENWQRLDSKRLPWRIAAPFRAGIDPAFRDAQTPESQRVLRQLADRIGGSGWTRPLQVLQQLLAKNQLREAFRQVEALLPAMRRDHPDIVPRLGHVFF